MAKELLMGMGETYDILFTVPENKTYEFRATSQDVQGYASVFLGQGDVEYAPHKPKPNIYKMDMDMGDEGGGHGEHGGHVMGNNEMRGASGHAMSSSGMTMPLKYSQLKAKKPTNFPAGTPETEFKIVLGGDMERYVWFLNNKLLSEDTYIDIQEGNVIRFVLENKTMMHHPMHLHGHFFRLVNGQGNFAPLKHTVDVPPMKKVVIEFLADEPGQWFFHCHNLYHLKAGMGRVIRYVGFDRPNDTKETKEGLEAIVSNDQTFYPSAEISTYSNGATWDIRFNGGRYEVQIEGELTDYDLKKIENEIYVKHYFTRNFNVFGGVELEDQRFSPIVGASYVVPLNFELVGYVNASGTLVFKVEKRLQITKRLYIKADSSFRLEDRLQNTEIEYGASLNYSLNRNWSVGLRYQKQDNSDNSIGVGITYRW
jgi:hypothetical protein